MQRWERAPIKRTACILSMGEANKLATKIRCITKSEDAHKSLPLTTDRGEMKKQQNSLCIKTRHALPVVKLSLVASLLY